MKILNRLIALGVKINTAEGGVKSGNGGLKTVVVSDAAGAVVELNLLVVDLREFCQG
jgi:hypothetical protein